MAEGEKADFIDIGEKKSLKVKLSLGEKKWLCVREKTSSGYVWEFKHPSKDEQEKNGTQIKIEKIVYKGVKISNEEIGKDPNLWFLVEAISLGSYKLEMDHLRPWDKSKILNNIKLTFEVKDNQEK